MIARNSATENCGFFKPR